MSKTQESKVVGCYDMGRGLTICTGSNTRYRARTRGYGHRRYDLVGKPTRSYHVALMRMTKAFEANHNIKRADVIMTADYYDPLPLCELVRY